MIPLHVDCVNVGLLQGVVSLLCSVLFITI